jgi:DNA-binding CsgD family transcriptional regulator
LTITAVTDAEDSITHFVGAFTDITSQKQAERILLDTKERLENQVVTDKEELEKVKTETVEINSALNILLKHRETDKSEAQIALSQGVAETILPFLKLLKAADAGRIQSTRLVDIIENNLNQLTKSFGLAENNLPAVYLQLTRVEIQVASLVRQGLSTKAIATTLKLSSETINNHRKHIRKKLKLDGKANNLHSYLLSLSE